MVFYSRTQTTRRMGQSCGANDDKILQKADTQFSVLRVHCQEERSKAKVVENCQYTSVPMGIRLKLFFAQLFLLFSSVSTEQSQKCVKNVTLAMLEQGDLLWKDNPTHCLCQV